MRYVLCLLLTVLGALSAKAATVDLVIMAGQSNLYGPALTRVDFESTYYAPSDAQSLLRYDAGRAHVTGVEGILHRRVSQLPWGPMYAIPSSATAVRMGHELVLARKLREDNALAGVPNQVLVLKVAYGGSSLNQHWYGPEPFGFTDTLLQHIADTVQAAGVAGYSVRFLGFFWIQGESDTFTSADAHAYFGHLMNLVADVRSSTRADLPIVIELTKAYPGNEAASWFVRRAQLDARIALAPGAATSNVDDIPRNATNHFDAVHYQTMAARLHAAYRRVLIQQGP